MRPRNLVAALLAALLLSAAVVVAFPPSVPGDVGGDGTDADGGAGAGAPDAATADGQVRVVGGDLGVDQNALWNWTRRALDREANFTPAVVIREVADPQVTVQTDAQAFRRLMVYDDPDDSPPGGVLAYVTALSPNVTVNAARLPAIQNGSSWRTVAGVLVHEFTHVLQFQTPAFATNQLVSPSVSTDERTAYQAMVEGGAEFVADDYTEASSVQELREIWRDPDTPATYRLSIWPYYRGLVYLDERLDAPADLWSVYEDRPPTTAAILRGEVPGGEPPDRTLTLTAAEYEGVVGDRLGAAFAEVALSKEVAPERARRVAAGWRWGRLRTIQRDPGGPGTVGPDGDLQHVWITEWRGEDEADAFAAAMREYLDGRFDRSGDGWEGPDDRQFALRRVDDEALALVVGSERFLGEIAVQSSGTEYTIGTVNRSDPSPVVVGPTPEPGAPASPARAAG